MRSGAELDELGRNYAGRPTPLTLAERFAPGKRLYLKREDLLHTGAHKLNNALGQALLARRLGKRRIVAETGAGQHGVATATVCARFGLDCVVYMGAEDMRRQRPNVERMALLGAEVRPGRVRHADAEGGDERGDPRLDHQRRDDALPDRLVRRPGAVPRDRARAAVGDRPRGARADARGRGPAAGGRASRASAAARTRSACSPASSTTPRCGWSASRPRGAASPRLGPAGGAARRALVGARRRGRAGARRALDLGRPRLPGRRPRARVPARQRPRRVRRRDRRGGARRLPAAGPDRGDHPRARAGARARARRASWTRSSCSSASPAAATRTSPRSSPGEASRRETRSGAAVLLRRLRRAGVDALRGRAHAGAEPGRAPRPAAPLRRRRRPRARGRRRAGPLHDRARAARRARSPSPTSRRGQLELNRERVAAGASRSASPSASSGRRARPRRAGTDGSFDATVCFGGPLSYVVDRAEQGIAELVRVTKPGGHVLVSVMSLVGTVDRTSCRSCSTSPAATACPRATTIVRTGLAPRRARLRAPGDEAVPLERARGAARAARDDRRRVRPPACCRPSRPRSLSCASSSSRTELALAGRAGRGLVRPAHRRRPAADA